MKLRVVGQEGIFSLTLGGTGMTFVSTWREMRSLAGDE